MTNVHYFTDSLDQASKHSLAGRLYFSLSEGSDQGVDWCYGFPKAGLGEFQSAPSSRSFTCQVSENSPPSRLLWLLADLRFSLSVSWSHWFQPFQLLHRATHSMEPCFWETDRQTDMQVTYFCKPVSAVTSHTFCYVLYIRSEWAGPVHIRDERIAHKCGQQRWRVTGGHGGGR